MQLPVLFTSEQEEIITAALHEHRQIRLWINGLGEFEISGQLRRILRIDRFEFARLARHYSIRMRLRFGNCHGNRKSIPDEEWDNILF